MVEYIYQPIVKPDNEDDFLFFFNSTILVFLFKFLNTTWAKHLFENETHIWWVIWYQVLL